MGADATIVDYYARRAREYERIYQKPERQQELFALRALLSQAFTGRQVLELACRTGYWTEVIAPEAASVTAIDVNDKVLEIARSKRLDPRKVEFHRADVYALSDFERRFTGGLAAFWWSHVPKSQLRSFLKQFHRVFAPGATVVFMDNTYVEGSSTPISHEDAKGNTYQKRPLGDGSTHYVLKNFPTADEFQCTLEGLARDVQIEFLQCYWTLTYVPGCDA